MMHEMKPLFGSEGLAALQTALRARPLMAFDFDGTLAPLVPRPEDARVPPPLSRRLRRLARCLPLAIVTGRSVEDVAPRLGFTAAFIVGNHGAEEAGVAPAFDPAPLDLVRDRIGQARSALATAGIQVEDKRFSLALHYRRSAEPALALACIDGLLADLPSSLQVVPGRMVRNVVLADAPDKGVAVAALLRRADRAAAIFVGDDVNDETVFSAAPPDWVTVRVGRDYPQSRARYFLDDYADVGRLVAAMLEMLQMLEVLDTPDPNG
jgi:trehalose 6-phosphate phosphatase